MNREHSLAYVAVAEVDDGVFHRPFEGLFVRNVFLFDQLRQRRHTRFRVDVSGPPLRVFGNVEAGRFSRVERDGANDDWVALASFARPIKCLHNCLLEQAIGVIAANGRCFNSLQHPGDR